MGFVRVYGTQMDTSYPRVMKVKFDIGRMLGCEMYIDEDEMNLYSSCTINEFECNLHEFMLDYLEKELQREREKMNRFKAIAEMLGVEYRKRFKTDGYGEHRIDHNGVYSYEDNKYDKDALVMLLMGTMKRVKEENLCDTK